MSETKGEWFAESDPLPHDHDAWIVGVLPADGSDPLYGFNEHDAKYVATAANAFPLLVEALEEAVFRLRAATLNNRTQQEADALRKADAALAKASPPQKQNEGDA